MRTACLLSVVLGVSVLCHGETLIVDWRGAGDFTDIQSALDASESEGIVLVRCGEYVITEPLDFNRLRDTGGPMPRPTKNIKVQAESGPCETVIRLSDASPSTQPASVVVFHSGESRDSILEGFVLTGGRGSAFSGGHGGGGVLCMASSSPTLRDCILRGNVGQEGAGLFCSDSSPALSGCVIERNVAEEGGGAVFCTGGSTPSFTDCSISDNNGAGLKAQLECIVTCTGSRISGNKGSAVVASLCSVTFTNCLIYGNAGGASGAVLHSEASDSQFANCTVADNLGLALVCDGFPFPNVVNSVFWGVRQGPVCGQVSYCLTAEDPSFVRSGVFDFRRFLPIHVGGREYEVPDFTVDEPDYRLRPDSPGIDGGTEKEAPQEDIDGRARPCGEAYDAGAYETGCPSPDLPFRRGDTAADGNWNLTDAVSLLSFLFVGEPPLPCLDAADADDSGAVDLTDSVHILRFLFLGGAPPSLPLAECGIDPSEDELGCESFPPCD